VDRGKVLCGLLSPLVCPWQVQGTEVLSSWSQTEAAKGLTRSQGPGPTAVATSSWALRSPP
jgi:hypothetical protein